MRRNIMIAALLICAACGGSSPTAPTSQPLFDGGSLATSGSWPDSGGVQTESACTARGGVFGGSGN